MNYLIYDLEFNQGVATESFLSKPLHSQLPFEIIQIGAVLLNENLDTLGTFNRIIKPKIYKKIHPFVENLTKITDEKLDTGDDFTEVFNDFLDFIGDKSVILCVWGTTDIKELIRNVRFFNLDVSSIPKNYIDIQSYASKYLNAPKGSRIGLRNASELLSIKISSAFHDSFHDACYTAEIFKKIYSPNIKPLIYNYSESKKRATHYKQKVDNTALIKQFEKMYKREMTIEEQKIIKLAYIMGKTNQFLIDI